MNLILKRREYRSDGIFSELYAEDETFIAVALEHAYPAGYEPEKWIAKVAPGVYTCRRGEHRLFGMPDSFSTFEVLNVEGHSGILFHTGNYNKDSNGCILLGEEFADVLIGKMITHSRSTFARFIALQEGVSEFTLTVLA